MKWNLFYVCLLPAIFAGCASGPQQPQSTTSAANGDSLVLQVKAAYVGAVGWSELYHCNIQQVFKGSMPQDDILLFTGISYEFNDAFIKGNPSTLYTLGLYRYRPDPDPGYNTRPGFRDIQGRIWQLVYVR